MTDLRDVVNALGKIEKSIDRLEKAVRAFRRTVDFRMDEKELANEIGERLERMAGTYERETEDA